MRPPAFLHALALLAANSCALESIDKPSAPDASQVLSTFAAPTGSLLGETASQRADTLFQSAAVLTMLCGFNPLTVAPCAAGQACLQCAMMSPVADSLRKVVATLGDDRQAAEDAGVIQIPELSGVSGFLTVHSLCVGWDTPSADAAHGRAAFSVGFTGRGLDPAGAGLFEGCELHIGDKDVRASGKLLYTFAPAERVPFQQVTTAAVVYAFEGSLYDRALDREQQVRLAVRNEAGSVQELSFEVEDNGSFVVRFEPDGATIVSRDERLRCEPQEMTCDVLSAP